MDDRVDRPSPASPDGPPTAPDGVAEEIDRERAEAALGRATKRISSETLAWRIEASRRAAARAQNRIAVATGEPSSPPSM